MSQRDSSSPRSLRDPSGVSDKKINLLAYTRLAHKLAIPNQPTHLTTIRGRESEEVSEEEKWD